MDFPNYPELKQGASHLYVSHEAVIGLPQGKGFSLGGGGSPQSSAVLGGGAHLSVFFYHRRDSRSLHDENEESL